MSNFYQPITFQTMTRPLTRPRQRPTNYPPIESGQRHGRLTITDFAGMDANGFKKFECRCDCGTIWKARGTEINRGVITQCRPCGIAQASRARMGQASPKRQDLSGRVFGLLTVIGYAHSLKNHAFWACKCACGADALAMGMALRNGRKYSCGCARRERVKKAGSKPRTYKAAPKKPKQTESAYSKSTTRFDYLQRQGKDSEAVSSDTKTALIIAARRTFTRWSEIAEMVGLTVDECKARCPQAA